MSTITNEAVIKVTADASGVESGLRQVEAATARTGKNLENLGATAQKTGKSLESLGAGPGLRNVGDGAGAAAGQVDRATKSMADSIQRATATMNAGAKGSAAYYEALANTRGLNVAALRPYLDQLDAVTRKTQQAAAAQRQLDAGNNFLAGLRAQAEGIGKTASQLAALRAEQLGVADDARPLIEQLQAAEESAGNAGNSISGFAAALAAAGASAGIASVVQLSDAYSSYIAQLRLATTGQTEFARAQASVQGIATSAQSDLASTASLYASITKSTRDLGIAQQQVANITEVVSLALKVSGASSQSASSAILQLSQAFASGVLRGDEFNSVNEASPRLMEALADGIGVPTGALRAMAEQGLLTTDVLANALPRALSKLQDEARSVETVGGAVTVLKDKIMLLVGATSQSSGVVAALSGGIKLLTDNLVIVGGAMATVAAVKLGSALSSATSAAYASVVANNARLASNLAAARSDVAATGSAAALAAARVAELRSAVLAAEGNVALAITTNALIPAQTKATAAAAAHAAALTAQAGAASAASLAGRAFGGVMALAGGPVGAIIGLLGIAATIWGAWSISAKEANDKVAQSTEESTSDMIKRLDEQIAKLRERNALAAEEPRIKALGSISQVDQEGLERAREALAKNRRDQQANRDNKQYHLNIDLRRQEIALSNEYEAVLERVSTQQRELAVVAARTRNERLDQWYEKNGTPAQRLAAELAELKKQFGAIPPEMEKLVRAKYVDPAATKAISEQAKAAKEYAELLNRINGKSLGVDSDYQENLTKLAAGYKAGKQTLAEYTETLEKYNAQQPRALQAAKDLAEFQDGYAKSQAAYTAVLDKRLQDAETEATRNEELARTYGMTKSAIEQMEIARLEEQLAQRATLGLTLTEIENIEKLIDVKKRSAGATVQMEGMDAAKKASEELKDFLDPARAQSFGDALREAFGGAGDSISKLTASLTGFSQRQAEIEKNRGNAALLYLEGKKTEVEYLAEVEALSKRGTQNQLAGYGAMTGAAAGFFNEQSRGYKALQTASQVFHAAELAMTLAELVPKGISAVLGQGQGDPYTAFGRMAAMAAIVAGLGVAIGGVSGGGVPLSKQRQEQQGTGTVLGDKDAKSESIANSLDKIEGATLQGLGISNGMLISLRNIEAGIDQFASLLVRTTGVTGDFGKDMGKNVFDSKSIGLGGAAAGGMLGAMGGAYVGMGTSYIGAMLGGPVGMALGAALGAVIGKTFIGKALGSVFGGKQTVEDTGLTIDPASFATIIGGGLNAMQFADIKKSGGWFRSDSYSTKTEGLGEEGNRQIASVLMSLYDTVFEAGTILGLGADDFAAQLNSFVVDIGKVSLKGLSDDEIEKELAAIFSMVGDELASFGVDGLQQFQKVGEGYLETLTRVATNYQAVSVVADSMGMTFDAVGLASVGARERLIDLVGGLDEFTSSADQFLSDFYTDQERANSLRARITPTLDQFGIKTGAEDSLQQFRSVVTGLDLTTEAGARAYATLMQIAPAFKQIADVDASMLEKRRELEIEVMELLGDKSGALAASRAIELAGMDASLRPLQQRVYALQDEAAALETSNSLLDIQAKIYELTGDKAGAAAVLAQQQANALAALDPALRGATLQLWALEAAAKATEKVKTDAASLMSGVDGAYANLQKVVERQKKALKEDIDVRTESIKKIEALSQSLRSTLDSMTVSEPAKADRQAAQAQIQAALAIAKASGTLPKAEDLKGALSVLSKDSKDLFATQEDYLRDFYASRNGIEDLAKLTDKSLSTEERSLKKLEDQVKQYDLMLEREQEQVDVLKGISTVGLSIEQAIRALHGAMAAARANPVNSAASAIGDAYRSELGRAPDQAGLDYWKNVAAGGTSTGAIVDSIKNSPEAQLQKLYKEVFGRPADAAGLDYWLGQVNKGISLGAIKDTFENSDEAKKKRIPGFAGGGYHAGGWRIVGENGPELEATGPARIFNTSDTANMMRRLASPEQGSAVLAAEIRMLREEVAALRGAADRGADAAERTAGSTGQLADQFDNATDGGNAMRADVVNTVQIREVA